MKIYHLFPWGRCCLTALLWSLTPSIRRSQCADMLMFLVFLWKRGGGGNAAAQLWLSVPAFQVSFYEKKKKKSCTLTFLLYHLNISINRFFPSPVSRFHWEDSPRRNSIHQASSEGEKKNKNLNKYFIRLFCDLMCFCSAEVWGNISAPFINALTQAYPTIV